MAFSAAEVRVLRCALAEVLSPRRGIAAPAAVVVAPRPAEYVQDCLRLADALDDAVREAGLLRAFLLDELSRYRDALPGTSVGYLERLTAALAAGYVPAADDLAALRRLRAVPCGTREHQRRTALLRRCETLAENDVRQRLEAHMPAPRRLLTLPDRPPALRLGGAPRLADEPKPAPKPKPRPSGPAPKPAPAAPKPAPKPEPAAPEPAQEPEQEPQEPGRRTPTPAEIWPPHRRDRKPDQARSA